MKRRHLVCSITIFLVYLLSGFFLAPSVNGAASEKINLNIATVDNRPLYIDRLLYMAFKDIGYQTTFSGSFSLQAGYNLANEGKRDGVISSSPNMKEMYPNLRQVPVVLEDNDIVVFTRAGSNLSIKNWSELSAFRVGILAQRLYMSSKIPAGTNVTTKETTKNLMAGLIDGEYDVVVLSLRAHEVFRLPSEVAQVGKIETLPEYLYVHEKHETLIPVITKALNNLFASGRGEKILQNIPTSGMYQKKTVLQIFSSAPDHSREDQFNTKLKEQFSSDVIEWYTIALDSGRFSIDPNRLIYFAKLLRQDFVSRDVVAIIVSGDDALEFLKEYYFLFFGKVPVLFYGIGDNYEEAISGYEPYFTGVVERLSALETVRAAQGLFPDTKNIYVVNDYSTAGKNYKSTIRNQLKPIADSINIEYNENIDQDSLLAHIKGLSKESIVFFGSYFQDENGQYFTKSDMKRVLERDCAVPIFALYSTDTTYNAIGGKCLDYRKYGEIIGGMLSRLLSGESVSSIPIVTDSAIYNQWVFDKNVMDKLGVEESSLPEGSKVINKAPSVWETNPKFAFSMLGLLVMGLIIIAGMYMFLKKLSKKNSVLLEMRKHLHTAEELLAKDVKIRDVKERLERIINTAPILYMLVIDGRVVEINENMKDILGLEIGEEIQNIHADQQEYARIIEMLPKDKIIINEIIKFKLKNGEIRRCLANITTIEYEGQQATIVWSVDIEQDEIKKDQLKITQQSLQTLLDTMPIAVRIIDLETKRMVYANKSCLELLEFDSYEDAAGYHISEMLPVFQIDGTPSSEKIEYMLNTIGPFAMKVEYLSAKGNDIDALLIAFIIDYKGRKSSVGIIRDLAKERLETELKEAALTAQEESRAKSAFLAAMSHEIRTPINSIIGFSELALDSDISPKTRDYLNKIRDGSAVLLQTINDILDISKIEAGKMELESIPFNIHDVFKICQIISTPKALEKGITLYCYAEPSVGKKLLGDPIRLRQALLNILANAIKFTNTGIVKLLAAIEDTTEDSVTMRFEVKDSGIGMSPEQIGKIFEPFVQADGSTTRKYGGTGLGLPITKNIIELMGGEMIVESTLGIGSKFSFTLTFETIDEPVEAADDNFIPCKIKKPLFKGTVLLCEDNLLNRQVMCEHLAKVGLEAVIAVNGRECVDIVAKRMEKGEEPFDLILTDIHMPVMDGLEAAKRLSAIGNKTPIVAVTADVMNEDKETYRMYGMSDYLAKPFRPQELWNCLLKYLNPVDSEDVNGGKQEALDQALYNRLAVNFVEDNQTTFKDMVAAIEVGDIKLAHRIAHTLKGVAGLIGKSELADAACAVEYSLKGEKAEVTVEQMSMLKQEIEAVLNEFAPLVVRAKPKTLQEPFDKFKAIKLFEKLETLLNSNDSDCQYLIDELRAFPGTEILIAQIERYDFAFARETLVSVKRILGV